MPKCEHCDGKGWISPVPGYRSGCIDCDGTGDSENGCCCGDSWKHIICPLHGIDAEIRADQANS